MFHNGEEHSPIASDALILHHCNVSHNRKKCLLVLYYYISCLFQSLKDILGGLLQHIHTTIAVNCLLCLPCLPVQVRCYFSRGSAAKKVVCCFIKFPAMDFTM